MTKNTPKAASSKEETKPAKASPTLIEDFEESPAGAHEMAAARLAVEVVSLLGRAVHESGVSQRKLGELLELSPGAVSQVVNSDGNLRVATIGRYFRALGYQARLFLEPVGVQRHVIASLATRSAIAAEFRAFVFQSGIWTDIATEAPTTPQLWSFEGRELGPSATWHRVTLPFDVGEVEQGSEPVT